LAETILVGVGAVKSTKSVIILIRIE